ncbi:MAG: hypothetical protein MZV65_15180 [Chromatiales bacterium]|nr:hypothetical protein [Chromatiales bacterium]
MLSTLALLEAESELEDPAPAVRERPLHASKPTTWARCGMLSERKTPFVLGTGINVLQRPDSAFSGRAGRHSAGSMPVELSRSTLAVDSGRAARQAGNRGARVTAGCRWLIPPAASPPGITTCPRTIASIAVSTIPKGLTAQHPRGAGVPGAERHPDPVGADLQPAAGTGGIAGTER